MSALGQEQTYASQKAMSALPPIATAKADLPQWSCPLTPESGHVQCKLKCLLRAISGLTQRSKNDRYSMTSSAAISKPGGTVKPSAFAVLRLTTVSNFVGVCTGRSAGFAPRRMRST